MSDNQTFDDLMVEDSKEIKSQKQLDLISELNGELKQNFDNFEPNKDFDESLDKKYDDEKSNFKLETKVKSQSLLLKIKSEEAMNQMIRKTDESMSKLEIIGVGDDIGEYASVDFEVGSSDNGTRSSAAESFFSDEFFKKKKYKKEKIDEVLTDDNSEFIIDSSNKIDNFPEKSELEFNGSPQDLSKKPYSRKHHAKYPRKKWQPKVRLGGIEFNKQPAVECMAPILIEEQRAEAAQLNRLLLLRLANPWSAILNSEMLFPKSVCDYEENFVTRKSLIRVNSAPHCETQYEDRLKTLNNSQFRYPRKICSEPNTKPTLAEAMKPSRRAIYFAKLSAPRMKPVEDELEFDFGVRKGRTTPPDQDRIALLSRPRSHPAQPFDELTINERQFPKPGTYRDMDPIVFSRLTKQPERVLKELKSKVTTCDSMKVKDKNKLVGASKCKPGKLSNVSTKPSDSDMVYSNLKLPNIPLSMLNVENKFSSDVELENKNEKNLLLTQVESLTKVLSSYSPKSISGSTTPKIYSKNTSTKIPAKATSLQQTPKSSQIIKSEMNSSVPPSTSRFSGTTTPTEDIYTAHQNSKYDFRTISQDTELHLLTTQTALLPNKELNRTESVDMLKKIPRASLPTSLTTTRTSSLQTVRKNDTVHETNSNNNIENLKSILSQIPSPARVSSTQIPNYQTQEQVNHENVSTTIKSNEMEVDSNFNGEIDKLKQKSHELDKGESYVPLEIIGTEVHQISSNSTICLTSSLQSTRSSSPQPAQIMEPMNKLGFDDLEITNTENLKEVCSDAEILANEIKQRFVANKVDTISLIAQIPLPPSLPSTRNPSLNILSKRELYEEENEIFPKKLEEIVLEPDNFIKSTENNGATGLNIKNEVDDENRLNSDEFQVEVDILMTEPLQSKSSPTEENTTPVQNIFKSLSSDENKNKDSEILLPLNQLINIIANPSNISIESKTENEEIEDTYKHFEPHNNMSLISSKENNNNIVENFSNKISPAEDVNSRSQNSFKDDINNEALTAKISQITNEEARNNIEGTEILKATNSPKESSSKEHEMPPKQNSNNDTKFDDDQKDILNSASFEESEVRDFKSFDQVINEQKKKNDGGR
ncbi:hypothetical protein HK096_002468, partial [Nowakowskiella sp. JEL0078]